MKRNKKILKRKEKGITLIALVITIIVLLILAGVTISMLTGENGILTQAQRAKEETEKAAKNEVEMLNEIEQTILNKTNGVEESVPGKYYDKDTDVRVGDYIVTIPGGATISNIFGEYEDVNKGLVIYMTNGEEVDWSNPETVQETYDQFVWIPVDKAIVTEEEIGGDLENYISTNNVYPMAVKKADETYNGILYDFTEENGVVKIAPKDYTTTSSYREPAYLTDVTNGDANAINNNVGITEISLQAEYKEIVEGIEEKGGFWVGRYETSNMNSDNTQDSTNIVKVVKGTTNGINNVDWYRMYIQQKNYDDLKLSNSTNVKSSMIWGSQWDQIMIWMREVQNTVDTTNGNYYITNSVGMGNFGIGDVDTSTLEPVATGNIEAYSVRNVYDLAGNVYEWTLEACNTDNRVYRRRLLQCYE